MSWLRVGFATRLVLGAAFGAAAGGCTPRIGDRCSLNTDCSIDNTRACDNSQPNGYCTVLNCGPNSCPDNAACVAFRAGVPGCPYDDYASPARTARTFCMETCKSDSDCRQSEGYVCRDPTGPPWAARIVDSNYARRVCLLPPDPVAPTAASPAPVCPGGVPPSGGGAAPSSSEGGVDAAEEGDAGGSLQADSGQALATDAGAEAAEDATLDAPSFIDSSTSDADGGGE